LSKPKQEKRSSKRVKLKARVPVRIPGQKGATEAETRDISLRGVYLTMETRVAHGSTMEVVLPLPATSDDDPSIWVHCKCRVVRVEEIPDAAGFGVATAIEEFQTVREARIPETIATDRPRSKTKAKPKEKIKATKKKKKN
jgi:hypothetical protein